MVTTIQPVIGNTILSIPNKLSRKLSFDHVKVETIRYHLPTAWYVTFTVYSQLLFTVSLFV